MFQKTSQFPKLFSGFFNVTDHRKLKGKGNINIKDDWEYIEVVDQELSSDGEDSESCFDLNCLTSPVLDFPTLEIKCTVLSKAEVLQRLEENIMQMTSVFALSKSEATVVLHHCNWSIVRAGDEWATQEAKVRKAVGLFEKPVTETSISAERACGICHESFPQDKMSWVSCGHQFCRTCWTDYISKAISDGPRCLGLRCPSPSCNAAVGLEMIEELSSKEDKKIFEQYLIASYVIGCQGKWCPSPQCEHAVFFSGSGYDRAVTCRCDLRFCWNCLVDAHAPVDCDTVARWMSEINAQSENWLLANTKPCPSCHCPVPQDENGKYMMCSLCDHEFCRLCGGDKFRELQSDEVQLSWYEQFYNCCLDESARPAGFRLCDEKERDAVKNSLERYNRFYEGWASNESSRANALADLKFLRDVHLGMMASIFGLPDKELHFLLEAQVQIAECYQVLKWTYVYGYFLSDDEHAKSHLLEFMQAQANNILGPLCKYVKKLENFLSGNITVEQFKDFHEELLTLTRVAKNYFGKMVEALIAGLPEVVPAPMQNTGFGPIENCTSSPSQKPSANWSPEKMHGVCSNDPEATSEECSKNNVQQQQQHSKNHLTKAKAEDMGMDWLILG